MWDYDKTPAVLQIMVVQITIGFHFISFKIAQKVSLIASLIAQSYSI